jgi:IS5 family transposase
MKVPFAVYDLHMRFPKQSETGPALKRRDAVIEWEMFGAQLKRIDRKERPTAAGRKPMERVLMFKMLILQNRYGPLNEALEYPVSDRLTFTRFLGIDWADTVSDAKTVRLDRERLREAKVFDRLFEAPHRALAAQGVKRNRGAIVAASSGYPRGSAVPARSMRRPRSERYRRGAHWGCKTQVSEDRQAKRALDARSMAANG